MDKETYTRELIRVIGEEGVSIKDNVNRIHELRELLTPLQTEEEVDMITSMIKLKIQFEVRTVFHEHQGWGAALLATGTGKSKIAVDETVEIEEVAARCTMLESKPRILVVVPTIRLRDDGWRKEFAKWGHEQVYVEDVQKSCYASLHKLKGGHYDLVVLDEGHNITEANAVFFENNQVLSCLYLSASRPNGQQKKTLLKKLGILPIYELSLDEAVLLGIIAPYNITVITTSLDNTNKYISAGNKKKRFFTTEKQNYLYLSKLIEKLPARETIRKRARFINDLRTKTNVAKLILKNVIPEDLKTIIFCGSIAQAESVCEHAFHYKSGSASFDAFMNDEILRMSCVDAVNEGHNIPGLVIAFMVQLNSTELDFIQRMGRTLRGKKGFIIILCVEDTVDKQWVQSALKAVSTARVRWVSLHDLRTGEEKISFD